MDQVGREIAIVFSAMMVGIGVLGIVFIVSGWVSDWRFRRRVKRIFMAKDGA